MNSIVRQFDQAATTYDANSSVQRKIADALAERLMNLEVPNHILEIGCGTGHLTKAMVERFPSSGILATDASQAMVDIAAKNVRGENLSLQVWQANECLDNLSSDFDLVVSSMAFQWFGNWQRTAFRLAEQTGRIAISVPVEGTFKNWIAAHLDLGFKPGVRSFASELDIRLWLGSLPAPLVGEVSVVDFNAQFESPLKFVQSLRQIGADVPVENHAPVNLKRVFAKFPCGIEICYSIAFITIQHKV